jgi:hypothetical protein
MPGNVAPIENLDHIDLIGKRNDGGVDLFVVAAAALDGSEQTRELLRRKIATYVQALHDPGFRQQFGDPSPERTTIVVRCDEDVDPAVLEQLGWLRPWVEAYKARLELRRQNSPVPLPEPSGQLRTSPPSPDEVAELARLEGVVLRLAQARYGDVALLHDETDLHLLQRLLDDGVVGPRHDEELAGLGVVIGQVFVARHRLEWVVTEDLWGRHLALNVPGTTVTVNPLTMLGKRVRRGEKFDVPTLYAGVLEAVERNAKDPDY